MRGIFAKCQEKAAALREEQSKQQARLSQQVSQSDIYFNSLNSNGDAEEYSQESNLPPYLSQQLLSNQYQQQNMQQEPQIDQKNGIGGGSVPNSGSNANYGICNTGNVGHVGIQSNSSGHQIVRDHHQIYYPFISKFSSMFEHHGRSHNGSEIDCM